MGDALLSLTGVHIDVTVGSRQEAVTLCGSYLLDLGAIQPEYVDGMLEREARFSSYMGDLVAIPHGTDEARRFVNFGQLVFLRLLEPIIWDTEPVKLCIGIAAKADEQVEILGNLAESLLNPDTYETLMNSNDAEKILRILNDREGLD